MNPLVLGIRSLLNIGGRGIPQFIKGRFQTGGEIPGGFRTNPFRGPARTVPRAGREEPFVKGKPWRDPKGKFGRRPMGPPKPTMGYDKGGYLYRHPTQALLGGAGLLGYGGLAGYDLLTEDDKPDGTDTGPSAAEIMRAREQAESDALAEKQPSMSVGHRTAYLKKRDKRLKNGMKQLLNQYMIIAAIAPDEADNFLKAGMKMMETDQEFNDDLYNQDIYDTIFQPGNMPGSGREAYQMLIQSGLDAKEAMKVAGDYADLAPDYKAYQYLKKEDMKLSDILGKPREQAIQSLIGAWVSNTFAKPDELDGVSPYSEEGRKTYRNVANAYLDLIQGSTGGIVNPDEIVIGEG